MGKAPGNPWARLRAVTDSATENRPPQVIVVRVKRWGKSPPRLPVTEAARQTPPEQGQISGEENAHSDEDAAGRLHEGGGDSTPRGMTATELRLRYRTRLTGCSARRPGSRERSWALIRQRRATCEQPMNLSRRDGEASPGRHTCRDLPNSRAARWPRVRLS